MLLWLIKWTGFSYYLITKDCWPWSLLWNSKQLWLIPIPDIIEKTGKGITAEGTSKFLMYIVLSQYDRNNNCIND